MHTSTSYWEGGLERGTSALLLGAAGVGKSSLALTYAIAAADRGEHAVFFAFDEGRGTVEARARTLGLPLESHLQSGLIRFKQIDPAEMSPANSPPMCATASKRTTPELLSSTV